MTASIATLPLELVGPVCLVMAVLCIIILLADAVKQRNRETTIQEIEVAEYVVYKLRQLYAARWAIAWGLGLIGVPATTHSIYGKDYGGLALFGYLLLSGLGYVVWVDYQDWKKEVSP